MNGTEVAPQSQGQTIDLAEVSGLASRLCSLAGDDAFRCSERDFTRDGVMRPELIMTLLLYMIADGNRRGYRLLLDEFWDEARSFSLELPTERAISAPSFCVARRKISADLIRRLMLTVYQEHVSKFGHAARWNGFRVLAVDGAKFNLQRHPDLDNAFGRPHGGHCPQVLSSTLFDACAQMPIDVRVGKYASSEREQLDELLDHVEPGDLLVLDRGYASHELLRKLKAKGVDYLIRLSASWRAVRSLRDSGSDDQRIEIPPPRKSPADWGTLCVRIVRLKNKDGEESFYVTSLPRSKYSRTRIRELYHLRWQEEEFYKLMKSEYIGQGQFRSKSPSGVVQEIASLELFLAIARYLMATAAEVEQQPIDQIGQKGAVLALASYVTRIFLQPNPRVAETELRALLRRISRYRYRKRPGRSCVRRSFKPNRSWTPQGRRGA